MSDRFDHTLEHTLESKPGDDAASDFRRIELITGTGRRRRWSTDEKARILVESLKPGANISDVARRNGLSPQQLFGWRREVREPDHAAPATSPRPKRGRPKRDRSERQHFGDEPLGGAPGADEAPAHFAAVVITAPTASPPAGAGRPGTIEFTIGDAVVRVNGQVDASPIAVVLRAVMRAT